ncbi:MAG: hypothetical protein HN929_03175 [Chloroflexi bacterium]|jgi:hypothetical protein|nr:hypothetical protein [Chloroflexota bacterium]MBT7080462.1 hypothetical protein [Chloroflexota bacterium]MBT7289165.1 hypothetical protein [Chloroflexota bacterium]
MNSIRFIGILLILTLLTSLVGCESANALISEDLRQDILASGEDINSYRFEGSMSMSSSTLPEINTTFDLSGAMDIENMNMSMTTSGNVQDIPFEMEAHLLTDDLDQGPQSHIMYINGEFDGESTGWTSEDVPFAEWEQQDQLAQQLETLSFAEVRHSGSETVDGSDCYVFDIILDMDEFIEFALQQPGMEDSLEDMTASELLNMMSNISMKYWVDKDTNLPVKQQMQFSMTIDEDTVDVDTTINLYDFNSPVNVTLPSSYVASLVLFSDDFSDDTSGWSTYNHLRVGGHALYKDGYFSVKNSTAEEESDYSYSGHNLTDFILEVESTLIGGTDDNWQIIACRDKAVGNYSFGISADGYYFIDKTINGEETILAEPSTSPFIEQGLNATNLIHVECIDNNLSMSVNGHLLSELTDSSLTSGDIGFIVYSLGGDYTEVAFDNLIVITP